MAKEYGSYTEMTLSAAKHVECLQYINTLLNDRPKGFEARLKRGIKVGGERFDIDKHLSAIAVNSDYGSWYHYESIPADSTRRDIIELSEAIEAALPSYALSKATANYEYNKRYLREHGYGAGAEMESGEYSGIGLGA